MAKTSLNVSQLDRKMLVDTVVTGPIVNFTDEDIKVFGFEVYNNGTSGATHFRMWDGGGKSATDKSDFLFQVPNNERCTIIIPLGIELSGLSYSSTTSSLDGAATAAGGGTVELRLIYS